MTRPTDPYRVLGLVPGASEAEVKRAYRRLAKQLHPDSAGQGTVAGFLAIQAAYEAIISSGVAEPRPRTTAGRTSSRPPAPGGPPRGQSRGPSGAGGARPAGSSPGGGESGRSGRGRPRRVATLGSTSYDDAGEREPEWDGATWYGGSSGTYWTVNPKEYADPRKHGPEYQARGRARDGDASRSGEGVDGSEGGDGSGADRATTAAGPSDGSAATDARRPAFSRFLGLARRRWLGGRGRG